MREKRQPTADDERDRNRRHHPPGGSKQMPKELRRHEQIEHAPADRDRAGKNKLGQTARQRPPGDQRDDDQPFADQPLDHYRRRG
jgi:hypothetical protein